MDPGAVTINQDGGGLALHVKVINTNEVEWQGKFERCFIYVMGKR